MAEHVLHPLTARSCHEGAGGQVALWVLAIPVAVEQVPPPAVHIAAVRAHGASRQDTAHLRLGRVGTPQVCPPPTTPMVQHRCAAVDAARLPRVVKQNMARALGGWLRRTPRRGQGGTVGARTFGGSRARIRRRACMDGTRSVCCACCACCASGIGRGTWRLMRQHGDTRTSMVGVVVVVCVCPQHKAQHAARLLFYGHGGLQARGQASRAV